jgi:hypothetical protein
MNLPRHYESVHLEKNPMDSFDVPSNSFNLVIEMAGSQGRFDQLYVAFSLITVDAGLNWAPLDFTFVVRNHQTVFF